jgi:hypothetical protein
MNANNSRANTIALIILSILTVLLVYLLLESRKRTRDIEKAIQEVSFSPSPFPIVYI